MFFVLEKFYDSVCLHKLIGLALERNFPKRLIYMAMQAYFSGSSVQEKWWGKAYSPPKHTGWLLLGKQVCTGGTLQHTGMREQRSTRAASLAS